MSDMDNDDPQYHLGVVQQDLRTTDANIMMLEEAWQHDQHNPMYSLKYNRLAKKEQLLLEERKIWAGAMLQNHCWQAQVQSQHGIRDMLKRMTAACNTGDTHELQSLSRARASRPPRSTKSRLRTPETGDRDQLLMLADAAEVTEISGPGPQGSDWRGTQPGKYTEPWVRESAGRRHASGAPSRTGKRRRRTHFASLAYDGVSFDVPVRLDGDEELATYVWEKLQVGQDESCTERDPTGHNTSLSGDAQGGVSYFSDYRDQEYAGQVVSGGTKLSHQGNLTPDRSNIGGNEYMYNNYQDSANLPAQAMSGNLPALSGHMPARSDASGRSLRQATQAPSRYDDDAFEWQTH